MLNYFRRQLITRSATETLTLYLVMSYLDYGNAILFGTADCYIQKMSRIQKKCVQNLCLTVDKKCRSKQLYTNSIVYQSKHVSALKCCVPLGTIGLLRKQSTKLRVYRIELQNSL